MGDETIHVTHEGNGWSVSAAGGDSARSHHFTKEAATYTGKALAARTSRDLVIHDIDGAVERQVSADRGKRA